MQLIYKATGATERIIQSRDGKTTEFPEEIQKFHSIMLSITKEVGGYGEEMHPVGFNLPVLFALLLKIPLQLCGAGTVALNEVA